MNNIKMPPGLEEALDRLSEVSIPVEVDGAELFTLFTFLQLALTFPAIEKESHEGVEVARAFIEQYRGVIEELEPIMQQAIDLGFPQA